MNTRSVCSRLFGSVYRLGARSVALARDRIRMLLGAGLILGAVFGAGAQATDAAPVVPPGFTGIGPVISGSVDYKDIPDKARKFLEKNCDGHAIVKCEHEYAADNYEIDLADGIEMEFDAKGELRDIEAPEGYSLSPTLLRAVVPGKLYNLLVNNGFSESVESVKHQTRGYRIGISDPVFDQVVYDNNSGVLTLVVEK